LFHRGKQLKMHEKYDSLSFCAVKYIINIHLDYIKYLIVLSVIIRAR